MPLYKEKGGAAEKQLRIDVMHTRPSLWSLASTTEQDGERYTCCPTTHE